MLASDMDTLKTLRLFEKEYDRKTTGTRLQQAER